MCVMFKNCPGNKLSISGVGSLQIGGNEMIFFHNWTDSMGLNFSI
jgi:hypothetical protein